VVLNKKKWLHWKETTWICVKSKVKVGFLTVDIFRLSVFSYMQLNVCWFSELSFQLGTPSMRYECHLGYFLIYSDILRRIFVSTRKLTFESSKGVTARLNETRFCPKKKSSPLYLDPKNLDTFWCTGWAWNCQIIFRCASIHGRAGFILTTTCSFQLISPWLKQIKIVAFISGTLYHHKQSELPLSTASSPRSRPPPSDTRSTGCF
jgi:hypothetical protein